MLRSFGVADFLTLANGACGMTAICIVLSARSGDSFPSIYWAAGLIPLALLFDFLDGRVARARREASEFGRELDSLGDLISFGVAPAAIAHACGLVLVSDQFLLVFFVLCGLSRLARYNVSAARMADVGEKVSYFEGTPIPTAVVPLGICVYAYAHDLITLLTVWGMSIHWPSLLFAVSGCLMISRFDQDPKTLNGFG